MLSEGDPSASITKANPEKEQLEELQQVTLAQRMNKFFNEDVKAARVLSAEEKKKVRLERISNTLFGNAFEKSIQKTMNVSMSDFVLNFVVTYLGADEERYFSTVGDVGEDVDAEDIVYRSCIRNVTTNVCRYEVPELLVDGVPQTKECHLVLDRGCIGRYHGEFLLKGPPKINGTVSNDIFHIFESIFGHVFVSSKIDFDKREANASYGCFHGPYQQQSFWQQYNAHSKRFYAGPHTNEVYFNCYERACSNKLITMVQRADPNHRKSFWEDCRATNAKQVLGSMSRLGRWGQFHEKHKMMKTIRMVVVMALIDYGIMRGWWPDVERSPLGRFVVDDYELLDDAFFEEEGAVAVVVAPVRPERARGSRDPPPPEPVEAAPRPVRASYDDVRKSRGKRRNGMDFACHVLSDNLKMRKLDVAVHLLDPFVMMELSALAEVKTPKGQLEVFLELSRGSLTNKCCQRMWASLKDPAFWDHGDFARDGSVTSLKRKADCAVADVVFDVLTTATCHFFLWEQEFTHGLPNYFHFLVSPVEQERVEAPPFAGFLLPPEIFGKNISMDFISPKYIVFASQNRIKNKWLKFIS